MPLLYFLANTLASGRVFITGQGLGVTCALGLSPRLRGRWGAASDAKAGTRPPCPLSPAQLAKHPVNRENAGLPTHRLLQSLTQKLSRLIEENCSQDAGQGALYLGLPTPLARSLRRAELLCQLQENQ